MGRFSVYVVFDLLGLREYPEKFKPKSKTYGRCLLIPKNFCAVYDCPGKADLSKGY